MPHLKLSGKFKELFIMDKSLHPKGLACKMPKCKIVNDKEEDNENFYFKRAQLLLQILVQDKPYYQDFNLITDIKNQALKDSVGFFPLGSSTLYENLVQNTGEEVLLSLPIKKDKEVYFGEIIYDLKPRLVLKFENELINVIQTTLKNSQYKTTLDLEKKDFILGVPEAKQYCSEEEGFETLKIKIEEEEFEF